MQQYMAGMPDTDGKNANSWLEGKRGQQHTTPIPHTVALVAGIHGFQDSLGGPGWLRSPILSRNRSRQICRQKNDHRLADPAKRRKCRKFKADL